MTQDETINRLIDLHRAIDECESIPAADRRLMKMFVEDSLVALGHSLKGIKNTTGIIDGNV